MEPYETHLGLAAALAVGLLVGLEREQSKADRGGAQLGGVRTYPIGGRALGKRVAVTGALIIVAGGVALAVTALA